MSTVATIEHSIEIDATPQRVWEVVADVRNAPQWSDQAVRVFARGPVRKGTLAVNVNHQGRWTWLTTSRVVEFEPYRRVANRVFENFTVWAFELEPTASGGTRLVERRETPKGISAFSRGLAAAFFGGQDTFTRTLDRGVNVSLQRIKRLVEQG